MTTTGITAPGLSGVLRMTWVHDELAHVLEHADVDEPSGTWTGLASPIMDWRSGATSTTRRCPA